MPIRHDAHVLIVGGGANRRRPGSRSRSPRASRHARRARRDDIGDDRAATTASCTAARATRSAIARQGSSASGRTRSSSGSRPGTFECNDGLFVAVVRRGPRVPGAAHRRMHAAPASRFSGSRRRGATPRAQPEPRAEGGGARPGRDSSTRCGWSCASSRPRATTGPTSGRYMEVTGLLVHDGLVTGAAVRDHVDRPDGRDPRRSRRQRGRALVGEGRRDGRTRACRSRPRRACCSRCGAASATW